MKFTPIIAALVLILAVGCRSTGTGSSAGKGKQIKGEWKVESFGAVLQTETDLNRAFYKAAPQLNDRATVRALAEEIDDSNSFKVIDWLMMAPDMLGGADGIVFANFKSPEIIHKGKGEIKMKIEGKVKTFRIVITVVSPVAYRTGLQYGIEKLPIQKTATLQYQLICDPGAIKERTICFHRVLRMDDMTMVNGMAKPRPKTPTRAKK